MSGGDFVAYQSSQFFAMSNNPDMKAVKAQLGSLYGINSMEIDPQTQSVLVVYDNSYLPFEQLNQGMAGLGYRPERL